MIDLVALMNEPQRDEFLLREAGGFARPRALSAALGHRAVRADRRGRPGPTGRRRDHTTVSRQVAKLVALGLVERRARGARRPRARGRAHPERPEDDRCAGRRAPAHCRAGAGALEVRATSTASCG
ncbi:MAG: hypothetical protein WDM81_17655 [Rhizomicrobium sp.]